MKYAFNEQAYLHFHSLELLETFKNFKMATDTDMAISYLAEKIADNEYDSAMARYLIHTFHSPDDIQYRKIAYYLASGCGIVRIINLLGTNQYQVYKVKDTMVDTLNNLPSNDITDMFGRHSLFIERLQDYMALFNVMDGFRVLEPSIKGKFLQGQVKGE